MINAITNDPTKNNNASEPMKVVDNSSTTGMAAKPPVFDMGVDKPTTSDKPNLVDTPPGSVQDLNQNSNQDSTPESNQGSDPKNNKPKSKNKFNVKMIAGVFALLLVVVGAGAGLFLSQQSQDLRQQADEPYTRIEYQDIRACRDNCISTDTVNSYCEGNVCVIDVSCENNEIWSGTQCVIAPENCPDGYVWTMDGCAENTPAGRGASFTQPCDNTSQCGSCEICNPSSNTCVPEFSNDCNFPDECDPACNGDEQCIKTNYGHYRCFNPDATSWCFYCDQQSQGDSSQGCPTSSMVIDNSGYSENSTTLTQCIANAPKCGSWQFDVTSDNYDGGWTWDEDCGSTPPPTNPPNDNFACNDSCITDTQCSNINSNWSCETVDGLTDKKCRLTTNPSSTTCEPPVITEPICRDIAILDDQDNVLDPTDTLFSIGMNLKFQCSADGSPISNYEFRITEPDGNIITGDTINATGSSSISKEYTVEQYLEHTVECRICQTTGCQDWQSIIGN